MIRGHSDMTDFLRDASAGVDIVRLFSGMVERPIGFLARYAGGGEYNTDLFPRDEFMTPERPAPKDAHSPPLAGSDAKASSRATRRRRPDRR